MAAYNKFQPMVEHLCEKVHNFASDQLVVALCAAANAPTAGMAILSEITQVSYTNLSSRNITTASSGQSGGTYSLVLTDLVLTASGAVATFRYVVIYNDTPTSPADPLISWFDHGSDVTLAATETYTINFDTTFFTLV